jgi:HK97 family phage major capsid protein
MKLTEAFKAWLRQNAGVAEGATDEEYRKAMAECLASGVLSVEKATELSTTVEHKAAEATSQVLSELLELSRKNADDIAKIKATPEPDLSKAMGSDSVSVEVKKASARYSDSKSAVTYPAYRAGGMPHAKAGQSVVVGGRELNTPSQLALAKCGVWTKFSLNCGKTPLPQTSLTEHENDLLQEMLNEGEFTGIVGGGKAHAVGTDDGGVGVYARKLSDVGISTKAVIDDATSGGLELNPIEFDDAVIMVPQLTGEFYPFIDERVVDRGTRIEGAVIENVTMNWGGADDTAISLFNTASFVSAFDTTIHVCQGAIHLGLDLLSNSPVALGAAITQQYGETLANQLDRVIANGSGVGEPTGIMVGSGTVSVASANSTAGPLTVGDAESLMFGVVKKYQKGADKNRVMYGMSEVTYQRFRGIAVGTGDARRVFGMDQQSYMLFDHPVGVSEALTNSKVFYAAMPRYRMYRRQGLTFRQDSAGDTLIRKNLLLISARARFGGQLTDGRAAAVMTDAKS